jgi:hypothetical protein
MLISLLGLCPCWNAPLLNARGTQRFLNKSLDGFNLLKHDRVTGLIKCYHLLDFNEIHFCIKSYKMRQLMLSRGSQ